MLLSANGGRSLRVGDVAAEQALSGYSEVVPSLEGLKQNCFQTIEVSVTTHGVILVPQSRNRNRTQLYVSSKH